MSKAKQKILKSFDEKYQSFKLSETIDAKSFKKHKQFLSQALDTMREETLEEVGLNQYDQYGNLLCKCTGCGKKFKKLKNQ